MHPQLCTIRVYAFFKGGCFTNSTLNYKDTSVRGRHHDLSLNIDYTHVHDMSFCHLASSHRSYMPVRVGLNLYDILIVL